MENQSSQREVKRHGFLHGVLLNKMQTLHLLHLYCSMVSFKGYQYLMYGASKKHQGYVNCGISQSNNTPGSIQFYLDNTTVLSIANSNKVH